MFSGQTPPCPAGRGAKRGGGGAGALLPSSYSMKGSASANPPMPLKKWRRPRRWMQSLISFSSASLAERRVEGDRKKHVRQRARSKRLAQRVEHAAVEVPVFEPAEGEAEVVRGH